MSGSPSVPGPSFSLFTPPAIRFGPRLGTVCFSRPEGNKIRIQTPGFLTSTSRGVIPHLSRDHYSSGGICWVNVPFESFLDVHPPVPTLAPGKNPLHSFLGFSIDNHVMSMSIRDPADGREMPANGKLHVCAYSLQGVRKVAPADWKSYVRACKPDVVSALSDIPFTNPPYSQKRLTKSIERSTAWLADIISQFFPASTSNIPQEVEYKPGILVHMAGGASIPARRAFAESLVEKLFGLEAEAIKPFETLDQGVLGYIFDLVPIRLFPEVYPPRRSIDETPHVTTIPHSASTPAPLQEVNLDHVRAMNMDELSALLRASLEPLPVEKLRLVNTVQTPHEVLRLISTVGIDLFDAHWAQRAADFGVAFDFSFPAPSPILSAKTRNDGKHDIGHNLYSDSYKLDFSPFSSSTCPCPCRACVPVAASARISHGIDDSSYSLEHNFSVTHDLAPPSLQGRTKLAVTKAYIHHLLHTHEMSAHTLLVLHNLSVLDAFFASIREFIRRLDVIGEEWEKEVRRFQEYYDETLAVVDEAKRAWREVDLTRGKGRLAREKRQEEGRMLRANVP